MDLLKFIGQSFVFFARVCIRAFGISTVVTALVFAASSLNQSISDLKSSDPNRKYSGIQALGRLNDRKAGNALTQALRSESDAQIRLAILDSLVTHGDAKRVTDIEPLLADPITPIRKRAAYTIGLLGGPLAETALSRSLAAEADPGVKAMILQGLSLCGSAQSVPAIQTQLSHPDAAVRAKAAEALHHIPGSGAKKRRSKGAR
jgi:HEAT repeat protein